VWTAILGIFAAVIGFLGVVVGAVVTGYVTLRQTQLATAREREARQAEREQARKDVRDAFQRENLLALQDAVMDMRKATTDEFERKLANEKDAGYWYTRDFGEPLPADWTEADMRVSKLRARVFDDDLRSLVEEFRQMSGLAITAQEAGKAFDRFNEADALTHRINHQIGLLLPDLF
jgi:hypothetical protein